MLTYHLFLQPKNGFVWDEQRIGKKKKKKRRKEKQHGAHNYGEPRASPFKARVGEHFYRGGKEVGRARVNQVSMAFHWLSRCQERGGLLLSVGLCCGRRTGQLSLLVSQLYKLRFLFINFSQQLLCETFRCVFLRFTLFEEQKQCGKNR